MKSTLRLFKALPVVLPTGATEYRSSDLWVNATTVRAGFVFSPEVLASYPNIRGVISTVEELFGRNSEKLNQTFHKSWEKVRDASIQQLVVEQLTHYVTTYGAESVGAFDHAAVYVPGEYLDAPELKDGLPLVIIHGLTKAALKDRLLSLLSSGVALSAETVTDVLDVATFVGIDESDLASVANREVRAALYDYLGIVPTDPTEFLRFVIYRATGETLLIKNPALIEKIKQQAGVSLVGYFRRYDAEVGLQRLGEIFNRFKPLFLAMRTNAAMKGTINRIRRLAVKNHRPMKPDYLNGVTAILARGEKVDLGDLLPALAEANTFRKIRLAYALQFRTLSTDSILYRIRNGKSWATEFHFPQKARLQTALVYAHVMQSIVTDIEQNVRGQRVYIPHGLAYALPATEKQFTGNIPVGTSVSVEGNLVAGIHWENVDWHRIDLDLSLQSLQGKIGWDGAYRAGGVLYSGDMTDAPAPKGATESFYIDKDSRGAWLVMVNDYSRGFDGEAFDVPFQVLVAEHEGMLTTARTPHTIDPNLLIAQGASTMDSQQKTIGLIVRDDDGGRFYFSESTIGSGRSSRDTPYARQARSFLVASLQGAISLNEVLADAGAKLVDGPADADIDLSLEVVDKTTLLGLIAGTAK